MTNHPDTSPQTWSHNKHIRTLNQSTHEILSTLTGYISWGGKLKETTLNILAKEAAIAIEEILVTTRARAAEGFGWRLEQETKWQWNREKDTYNILLFVKIYIHGWKIFWCFPFFPFFSHFYIFVFSYSRRFSYTYYHFHLPVFSATIFLLNNYKRWKCYNKDYVGGKYFPYFHNIRLGVFVFDSSAQFHWYIMWTDDWTKVSGEVELAMIGKPGEYAFAYSTCHDRINQSVKWQLNQS